MENEIFRNQIQENIKITLDNILAYNIRINMMIKQLNFADEEMLLTYVFKIRKCPDCSMYCDISTNCQYCQVKQILSKQHNKCSVCNNYLEICGTCFDCNI